MSACQKIPVTRLSRLVNGRTEIVGTIGPACRDEHTLHALFLAGMRVVRLHFGYADEAEHAENVRRIRNAAALARVRVAILLDLPGTKVRVGALGRDSLELREGDLLVLGGSPRLSGPAVAPLNFPEVAHLVQPGDTVLLSDGAIVARARAVLDREIHCTIERGGTLKAHQAVHVPGRELLMGVPTDRDKAHIRFALAHQVDWIAQSFVSRAEEIHELRAFIGSLDARLPIIAKIERRAAFEHLDEILHAADGLMVARGDLGLSYPIEEIGFLQKHIIRSANSEGIPVITATEMLSSMIHQPYPTRAEVTDIANAVLDGTDAVMLSGETGIGRFPVESVQMAARVAARADRQVLGRLE